MNKIIWCCWFQGFEEAPFLVKQCINSWKNKNQDWDFRFLDKYNIREYIPLEEYIDLNQKQITGAALSDIVRIMLLHEYGGVWVDATTYCNIPLDDWLSENLSEGFFAFDKPGEDRLLSSWFLAAEWDNPIVNAWHRKTIEYWKHHKHVSQYFWFHYLFAETLSEDEKIAEIWDRVPKISADGPHSLQKPSIFHRQWQESYHLVDWKIPVFKLTYRIEETFLNNGYFLNYLLSSVPSEHPKTEQIKDLADSVKAKKITNFASLKTSTENLGDHIQICAALDLQKRFGIHPSIYILIVIMKS